MSGRTGRVSDLENQAGDGGAHDREAKCPTEWIYSTKQLISRPHEKRHICDCTECAWAPPSGGEVATPTERTTNTVRDAFGHWATVTRPRPAVEEQPATGTAGNTELPIRGFVRRHGPTMADSRSAYVAVERSGGPTAGIDHPQPVGYRRCGRRLSHNGRPAGSLGRAEWVDAGRSTPTHSAAADRRRCRSKTALWPLRSR